MNEIRGNTQVLFVYRLTRVEDGTESVVYYAGSSVQQVREAALALRDGQIKKVETLYPVQVVLSNVRGY